MEAILDSGEVGINAADESEITAIQVPINKPLDKNHDRKTKLRLIYHDIYHYRWHPPMVKTGLCLS